MRPLTDDDFPMVALAHNVYRRTESSPICTCADQDMAAEIARRLNDQRPPSLRGVDHIPRGTP
jgi:hypothetical protein